MRNETRALFNKFHEAVAALNSVPSALQKFDVNPVQEQKLEKKIQESSDFLKAINVVGVDNLKGEKIGLSSNSTIAGRTDTSGDGERKTKPIVGQDSNTYECRQTNFDSHIRYALLDAWRHKPEFAALISNLVAEQIGRDRIMIGFNGTQAAATTDRTANPLLQDVNIGWIQSQLTNKAESVLDGLKVGTDAGGDYKNLDAMVYDLVSALDEHHRDRTDLVVITGRDLIHDKHLGLINDNATPTERQAAKQLITGMDLGGLPVRRVPFFPSDALMITTLSNLSIYYQNGSTRRHIQDEPKKDRVEDYRSVNEAYVVEDHGLLAVATGILTTWA